MESSADEIAPAVAPLIAITPCAGCGPGLTCAISMDENSSSLAIVEAGKSLLLIFIASGHRADAIQSDPFIGEPGSPRLMIRVGERGIVFPNTSLPQPWRTVFPVKKEACLPDETHTFAP